MEHRVEEISGVTVIHLNGAIDVSQAFELRNLLSQHLEAGGPSIVVDLAEVPLIDSSGIGVMVTAHRRAEENGTGFGLAAPSDSVGKVFELTRTNRLLRIHPTVGEAVEALSG